ncbi:MAG: fumarylacetoacetate hydrolase family protein, partial [Terriglobia bacterium]
MAHYCRFEFQGSSYFGEVQGEIVEALTAAPWQRGRPAGRSYRLADVRLLAPAEPSKIICVGRNYRDHAAELGNPLPRQPLFFLKPPSSLIGPEDSVVYPQASQRVDFEGELALIIGRRCRQPKPKESVLNYVFGFTCLNDVTARDLQKADGSFTRGKGFDTFCPLGPLVATGLEPGRLKVETFVNGTRRQQGGVKEMIFPLDVIIRHIAAVMTLEAGDVISTGTPAGVGSLEVGDSVEVVIEGIGRLRN